MSRNHQTLFGYFGHHRCASTWIYIIVSQLCHELGWKHSMVSNPGMFNEDLKKYVHDNQVDFLSYTNANYEYVLQLNRVRGFHVVRDPRDLCISSYFSHRYSHSTDNWPELINHRRTLECLSKDEGILLDMRFNKRFLDDMLSWDYNNPEIIQVRVEDIMQDPYLQFTRIISSMGILDTEPLSIHRLVQYNVHKRLVRNRHLRQFIPSTQKILHEALLRLIWENRYEKMSGGRRRGEEDPSSHYRKGVAGDWRNHFKFEHIQYFKEHYNPVLLKLGYETDLDWA